jgi:CheY-like chemotaxis protein/HPt (histidine-containing phosphotransfer) domain-containing protein
MSQMQAVVDRGPAPPNRIRVLAVEDVAVNRELMRLFLAGRGFDVEVACDGVEAVGAVEANDYDLVFMDVQMPGLDGLDATRQIRAMGGRAANLPIVALSANMIPGDVQRCLDAGMTAHLGKPFTSDTLVDAVRRWVIDGDQPSNPTLDWLRQQSRPGKIQPLLEMLLGQLDNLERCEGAEAGQIARYAHALRGAAGTLGFGDLAAACRQIELECREGGSAVDALSRSLPALAAGRRWILAEIKRVA